MRRPNELFKHEAHCFANPDGTCLYYGNPWSECEDHYRCGTEGPNEQCRRWGFEDWLHTPETRPEYAHVEADRLAALAEIEVTTVKPA
jgi:hypothetical protein